MSNGFEEADGLLPDNIMEVVAGSSRDFTTSGIEEDLRIATEALEIAEAEIAVVMAGCLSEAMECDQACQQCIRGILERDLENVNDVLGRVTDRRERDIQQSLSAGRLAAMSLGVPITDLTLVNGVPITTNGVSNFIPENPEVTVSASICNDGFTPVVTPENSVVCVAKTTPQEVIEAIETGGPKPPGSPPLVTSPPNIPQTPIDIPQQPPQIPVAPVSPSEPPAIFEGPDSFNKVCIDGRWIGVNEARQRYPALANIPFSFLATENLSRVAYWEIPSASLPAGWSSVPTVRESGDYNYNFNPNCAVSGQPPVTQCPPCQPQQPPPGGPLPPGTTVGLCDPQAATRLLEQVQSFGDLLGGDAAQIIRQIGAALGFQPDEDRGWLDLISHPTEVVTSVLGGVAIGLIQTLLKATSAVGFITEGCSGGSFAATAGVAAFSNIFGGWFGLVPQQTTVTNTYALNLTCQYLIPTTAEANAAWNRGFFTDDQWDLTVRANGHCPEWQKLIRKLGQQVPTVDQAAMMERRKLISYDEYKDFAARNGVIDDADKALFYNMTEFVPGPSDLVRFMVRDAFDDSLETNRLADQELPAKFTERAKQWAASQGIPEDVFKFFWRAHYVYPSPTQLYSMLHRLRKDTPLPQGQGSAKAVDVALIRRVLQINDLSPEFVDRLIALSYSPLTRVDSRRAFELGELSEEELRDSYLDLGYSPENSERLLRFSKATSGPIRAKRLGNASTTEVLKWYQENLIPKDQARELLRSSGVPEAYVSKYLETADLRRITASRKLAIAAIRKRFNHGELSTGDLVDLLNRASVSPDRIGELINNWTLVRDAKYKAPTVGMLCDWWSRGFITMDEFTRRCTNLGYSLVDAERIVANCSGKLAEKKAAEAEKLAKEAERRQRQIESDRRRAVRDQKTLEKEIRAALLEAAPCKPPPKPTCEVSGTTG